MRILELVLKRVPETKLLLIGGDSTGTGMDEKIVRYVEDHGLSRNVSILGDQSDVDRFYSQASVQLITSEFEGYPLVLAEGKQHGLPCVMYELPYLFFFENPRGIASVPMRSIDEAARAVCDLLENPERYAESAEEAMASARELDRFDLSGQWTGLFSTLSHPKERKPFDGPEFTMWSSLFDAYETCVKKHHELLDAADRNLAAAYAAHDATIEEFERSASYRIGRAITSVPRTMLRVFRRR